ncbi:MAG: hypothetical protein ACK5ZG_10185 [Phycisphaerae bacterium]
MIATPRPPLERTCLFAPKIMPFRRATSLHRAAMTDVAHTSTDQRHARSDDRRATNDQRVTLIDAREAKTGIRHS